MTIPIRPPHRTKDDFFSSLLCLFLIPAIWLLLGWTPQAWIAEEDGIAIGYPLYKLFAESHGDWSRLAYSAFWKGGSKIQEIVNFPYDVQGLSFFKLSPVILSNAHYLFIQFLFASLSLLIARDLLALLTQQSRTLRVWEKCALITLCAFSPLLGWRIHYGHDIILIGALAFLSGLAILLANAARSWNPISTGLVLAALTLQFQSVSQQTLVYSAVFGAPVFAALILMAPRETLFRRAALLRTAALLATPFLLSLPKFWPFLQNAWSYESMRGLGAQDVTYSYITSTLGDWASSLFWSKEYMPTDRHPQFWHEVHYGLGALILSPLFLPLRKTYRLTIGVLLSVALAVLFSMDAKPVSDFLLAAMPLLKSFRVPARAIIPVATLLPILFVLAVIYRSDEAGPRQQPLRWLGVGLIAGLTLFFAPAGAQDPILWVLTLWVLTLLGLIALGFLKKHASPVLLLLLALMSVLSVSSFKEKLSPEFAWVGEFAGPVENLGASARAQHPELASPLERLTLEWMTPQFQTNTALAAGLSSVNGYWFNSSRYVKTLAAISGRAPIATEINHFFTPRSPEFPVLKELYNIRYRIFPQGDRLAIEALAPTLGPAWFSRGVLNVSSYAELGTLLRNFTDLKASLTAASLLVTEDPQVQALGSINVGGECGASSSGAPEVAGSELSLVVRSRGNCVLNLSTNYVPQLRAEIIDPSGEPRRLEVFPVYGALTGVLVPSGDHRIRIHAEVTINPWTRPLFYLGILLALIVLLPSGFPTSVRKRFQIRMP